MASSNWSAVRKVLEGALERPSEDRAEFVRSACLGDAELAREVERLLARDCSAVERAFEPDPALGALSGSPVRRPVAQDRIGRYRLIREIDRGGMGTVFEAEQDAPRRRVAVKVMHWSLRASDLSRFRYEAEVLGRLQHPGIAQILEAGIRPEESEVPFFAMEFVEDARTLLEYADSESLDERSRIELFLDVCDAVHFGHQKGVIHRDLKPSNVLVNGNGEVKLIDFGIARAARPGEEERTMQTLPGQILGTLAYMSPEQLTLAPRELDTRTDVYSLGVVLYELLCGALPYDIDGLPMAEVARIVSQTPPLAPHDRGVGLARELEWILRKALEKERDRRFPSASEFAADLRRYIAFEPVLAGPPTKLYLARLFLRRHAIGAAASALVFLALLIGAIGTSLGMLRARDAEDLAEERLALAVKEAATATAVSDVMGAMLTSIEPERFGADVGMLTVLRSGSDDVLRGLEGQPEVDARFRRMLGSTFAKLNEFDEAEPHLERAHEYYRREFGPQASETLVVQAELARCLLADGRKEEARRMFEAALSGTTEIYGARHARSLELRFDEERFFVGRSDHPAHVVRLEELLTDCRDALGGEHELTHAVSRELALGYELVGRFDEALALLRPIVEETVRLRGADSARAVFAKRDLALVLRSRGAIDEAEALLDEVREACARRFGVDTRLAILVDVDRGRIKKIQRKIPEALEILAPAHARCVARHGLENPTSALVMIEYADALYHAQRLEEAEEIFEAAIASFTEVEGATAPATVEARKAHARVLIALDEDARAEEELRAIAAIAGSYEGPEAGLLISIYYLLTVLVLPRSLAEATDLAERARTLARERLPAESLERLSASMLYGLVLVKDDRVDEAIEPLEEAFEGFSKQFGATHERSEGAGTFLIQAYEGAGRTEDAEAIRRRMVGR